MRKIFLILIFTFFGNSIFADVFFIDEIEINGVERIERETVLSYSKLNIDNPYSNEIT
jgi:outer membrane protein assembly factor BamA